MPANQRIAVAASDPFGLPSLRDAGQDFGKYGV
jgi:hypothetical protein